MEKSSRKLRRHIRDKFHFMDQKFLCAMNDSRRLTHTEMAFNWFISDRELFDLCRAIDYDENILKNWFVSYKENTNKFFDIKMVDIPMINWKHLRSMLDGVI